MAISGCGYVVEPSFLLEAAVENGQLEMVLTDHDWLDLDMSLVFPPSRRLSKRTRVFADRLANSLGEQSPDTVLS